jgi:hypothetical protein
MRSAGNFSSEWGYLAPAPSFMRMARVVVAATAIGAAAGAAVVLSLIERPAIDGEKSLVAAHAAVTSVQAATAAPATPAITSVPANLPPAAQVRVPAPPQAAPSAALAPPAADSPALNASTAAPATAVPPTTSPGMTALSEAPPAADAAPSDLPDGTTLAPDMNAPPKKSLKHGGAVNAKNQPIPGQPLRRMFTAHTGTSYFP